MAKLTKCRTGIWLGGPLWLVITFYGDRITDIRYELLPETGAW